MSAITTTATTDLSTLAPKVRKQIATAYAALKGLEPSPARIRRAAVAVGALRTAGLSIRGTVAVLSVEGQGTLPVGKGTIERMGYVADGIAGEWPDTGDSADAILMALYRIAQTGRAADVARAAELGRKSTDGEAAFAAVDAVRMELNAGEHKSLTTAPARPVAGEAADGGKQEQEQEQDSEQEQEQTPADATASLAAVGTGHLIAELHRRYTKRGATVHSADADALATLTAAIEALIVKGRVTA